MKANFYFKMIAFLLIATTVTIHSEAQPRGNSSNAHRKSEKQDKKGEKSKHADKETAYRYDKLQHGHIGNGYGETQYGGHSGHEPYRHYDYDKHGNGKKIYRRYDDVHAYPHKINTYHHPRYGVVYRSFSTAPVRLRCHEGYYYVHGGHYYRLYPEVGYVRVEVPRSVVFYEIPSHAVRVRIGGDRYYRYGELVFERYDDGYRLAPPSVSVNLNF